MYFKTLSSFVSTAILPPIRVFLRETGKHVMYLPTSQSQKISRGRCNLYNVSNDTGMDQNLSKERPCDWLSLSHQYGKATMLMQQLVTKGATRPKPASQNRRERSRNQEPSKMWAKRPHCTRQWNKFCKLFQKNRIGPVVKIYKLTLANLANATMAIKDRLLFSNGSVTP